MPFAVVCPSCRGTQVLADEPAGQAVHCAHCGHTFPATSDRAPAPRRPRLHWYTRDAEEPERDESHIPRGVLAGLAVGALACLCGLVLLVWAGTWFLFGGRDQRDAKLTPPDPVWAPEPPPQVTWRVRPQPVAPAVAPARWREGALRPHGDDKLIYAFGASPFALILPREGVPGRVWDLAEMQESWALPDDVAARAPFALSPDGRTVAGVAVASDGLAIRVWSARAGQKPRLLTAKAVAPQVDWLAFPDDQQLLALPATASGRRVCRWTLADGKFDPPFETIAPQNNDAVAVSRGGQLLALFGSDVRLRLYDVSEGVEVGELDLSRRPRAEHLICRGLAFAPDVGELTAAFTDGGNDDQLLKDALVLMSWRLATGELRLDRTYLAEEIRHSAGIPVESPGLEWAPDGSGWLAGGRLLLDRATGALVGLAARPPEQFPTATAHFVGPHRLALLQERTGVRRLTVIAVPAKE